MRKRNKIIFQCYTRNIHKAGSNTAENTGNRSIGCIASICYFNQPIKRGQSGSVEYEPLTTNIRFKTGMKIGWIQFVRIACKITCRYGKCPAQGNSQMSKIPANTCTLCYSVISRSLRISTPTYIVNVIINPINNSEHLFISTRKMTKFFVG